MQKQNQSLYLIKSNLTDGQLVISLDILDSQEGSKIIRSFGINYSEDNLPEDIKKNFKDISNVHCILNDTPDTCRVNVEKGVITMVYHIVFPNGHKFELEGHLVLEQREVPVVQQTKVDSFDAKRLQKFQQNLQKLELLCQKETKSRQEQFKALSKQVRQDITILKQRYEEIKYWKSQQEIKIKQLQIAQKSNPQSSEKQKITFSDEFMHIFDQKFEEQKQMFSQKLQKQAEKIQDLKETSVRHQKIIDRLLQQNLELKKNAKALEERSAHIHEKSELIQIKLLQQTDKNQKMLKAINSQHEELEQIKTEVKSPKKQAKKQPMDPLLAFLQGNYPNQSKPNTNANTKSNPVFNLSQQTSPKASQNQTFTAEVMQIHPQSGYSKQFINNGKLIAYNGITQEPTQLVGKLKISQQRGSYLTVTKSKRNHIGFGVMDEKYLAERHSMKNSNYIILYGPNGGVYESNELVRYSEGGIKVGEKIKMRVNPMEGFIEWSNGATVLCKYKNEKLKDTSIEWIPFVNLCDRGDTVRWTIE